MTISKIISEYRILRTSKTHENNAIFNQKLEFFKLEIILFPSFIVLIKFLFLLSPFITLGLCPRFFVF